MRTRGTTITVRHRELLQTVTSSAAFEWDQRVINPGLLGVFPWLAPIASRYETYKFKQLDFEYVPRTASTTSGSITLIFDYDPTDTGPDTLTEALSYAHTMRDSVWKTLKMRTYATDRNAQVRRFTRSTGEYDSVSEPRTTDLGCLYVATDGCSADLAPLGEIWVSYTVELTTPQIQGANEKSDPVFVGSTAVGANLGTSLYGTLTLPKASASQMLAMPAKIDNGIITAMERIRGLLILQNELESTSTTATAKGDVDPATYTAPKACVVWEHAGAAGNSSTTTAYAVDLPRGSRFKPFFSTPFSANTVSRQLVSHFEPMSDVQMGATLAKFGKSLLGLSSI